MPRGNPDDLLSYQKLSWKLFKECLFEPLVYSSAAVGIVTGFVGQPELALTALMGTSIALAYYFLLGKSPRKRIQQQIEQSLQREAEERQKADLERRAQLYNRLDKPMKSHFTNLAKLEKVLQDKVASLGNRLPDDQIKSISVEVIDEAMRSLENRITYRLLLEQFDVRKLQEDLVTTKQKYEREKDYNLKRGYRETIQILTDEINDLKKLKAAMERLEQDLITAQSSLRSTILMLSQPQTVNTSQLNSQVAKLRREVEVAKKVNEELSTFQIGRRIQA